MPATPKYKAKAVFFDLDKRTVVNKDDVLVRRGKNSLVLPDNVTRFDSQHEFKVYLELCRMYGAENIVRQYPVEIYPPGLCYPKGKNWKVDFAIKAPYKLLKPYIFAEAKGAFLPEFAHTLASVECYQPEVFDDLYIVFGSSFPIENRVISSLVNSSFEYRLLTLKELQCLQHLPLPL